VPSGPKKLIVRTVWSCVVLLSIIGVAIVARRSITLVHPPKSYAFPEGAMLDSGFARHPVLTFVHITPGLLFIILGPLQFMKRIRARRLRLHRWSGRVFLASGMVVGVSALMMSPRMAIGGVNEQVAVTLFAILFLFALTKAFLHIRRREIALHREWMIRAYAIGLAVATARPIMGVFFATRPLTHLTPQEFFGTAFWLGFTLNLIAAEVWINYTRQTTAKVPGVTVS
jgi:uncharacterized membrane protein